MQGSEAFFPDPSHAASRWLPTLPAKLEIDRADVRLAIGRQLRNVEGASSSIEDCYV